MTYVPATWECDRCGDPVEETRMVTLSTRTGAHLDRDDYRPGYLGHYHLDCWLEVSEEVRFAAKEPGDDRDPLEAIPVAKGYEIRNLRREHRTPDGAPHRFGDPDLLEALENVAPKCRYALPDAGVTSLQQVAAMTDEQLLAIDGVGEKTVRQLRAAIESAGTRGMR